MLSWVQNCPPAPLFVKLAPRHFYLKFPRRSLHDCSVCNLQLSPKLTQKYSVLCTLTIHPRKALGSSSPSPSWLCWNAKRINWNKTPSVSLLKWRAEMICRLLISMHNHRSKLEIWCSWPIPYRRWEDMVAWRTKMQRHREQKGVWDAGKYCLVW